MRVDRGARRGLGRRREFLFRGHSRLRSPSPALVFALVPLHGPQHHPLDPLRGCPTLSPASAPTLCAHTRVHTHTLFLYPSPSLESLGF